ncbi:uncharacterized protein LOC118477478 [Aplysia californica]|uniref:Uncharacterized protein LOC118477478 n=1 Tax=Aplysia californica TaxID=6500 RepID=A0ABM1VR71_APLCA|nr:uncharacterized protein LOC118477478 [Aplysia californica]XP_035824913.1 uncharacterized protein LOC118477478 [Aplysia californica]
MRVILDLTDTEEDLYAEAVIEEAMPDGQLRLEYSLPGDTINACMETSVTAPLISIKQIKHEKVAKGEDLDDPDNKFIPPQEEKEVAILNISSFEPRGQSVGQLWSGKV